METQYTSFEDVHITFISDSIITYLGFQIDWTAKQSK